MTGHPTLHASATMRTLIALLAAVCLLTGMLAAPAFGNALDDVQLLREGGCGGLTPALKPLHHALKLDRAAAQWASGRPLAAAVTRAGYAAERLTGMHVTGADTAVLQALRQKSCGTLMNRKLTDAGSYRRGRQTWLVLASAYVVPARTRSASFATRVLALVNAARARGADCGRRAFGPAGPLHRSATLNRVAHAHAQDMAQHDYFQHDDRRGRTPADRVRAAGYRDRLVGENIAFGPTSAEEVVRGWLRSPGHCENIMDPRFTEMGVSYAMGHAPGGAFGQGLYWDQVLAEPL